MLGFCFFNKYLSASSSLHNKIKYFNSGALLAKNCTIHTPYVLVNSSIFGGRINHKNVTDSLHQRK